MKTHNIDSVFKKAIEKSEDFYSSEANASKDKIWDNVRTEKQKQPRLIFFWSLVAACIILFFSTTIITISNIKAKDKIEILSELNSDLRNEVLANNQNTIINKGPTNVVITNSPDTIYIEKEVIVSKPIVTTKVIVDTVFVDQIVYIEKEIPQEMQATFDTANQTDSTSELIAENYNTTILIRNSGKGKKEKKKKFRIKFGGNKDRVDNETLAFSKEF